VISGWHEAYLSDSEHLPVGYKPDVSPALDSWGVNIAGDCASDTDRGVSIGSANDEGAGLVGVSAGGEQCHTN
jgi:hypothetical protein